jgi:hypothetical protein
MNRSFARAFVLSITFAAALAGCGKHSPTCKDSVDLSSPWTDYGLPASDGRVCESSADKARVEYTSGGRDKWASAYDDSLQKNGFAKQKCVSNYCVYTKDKARVQVIVTEANKWTTVSLLSHGGSSGDDGGEKESGSSAGASDASASGDVGIAVCDDYVARATKCVKDASVVTKMKTAWKKKLAEGTPSSKIAEACEKANSVLKCDP